MSFKERCLLVVLLFLAGLAAAMLSWSCIQAGAKAASVESDDEVEQVYRRSQAMMGTGFEIQVVTTDPERAAGAIDAAFAEVDRVEALISEWQESSELSEVNRRSAAEPVAVGAELLEVVRRGIEISEITDGAFDITFAGCGHLWSLSREQIPTEKEIEKCLPRIDYTAVVVDDMPGTIALLNPETKIGLGGIGKGYGVDRAAQVLNEWGIENFVVDGGGDLRIQGERINRPWSVGVAHPRNPEALLGTITIRRGSVVTSGDYERYFMRDGIRYHHLIDPGTGRPARRAVAVTVIAPDATSADALATAFFIMGPKRAVQLSNEIDGVEVLVIAPDLSMHGSANIDQHFRPAAVDSVPWQGER